MPVMSGLEATVFIKTKLCIKTPVIALTANVSNEMLTQCKAIGFEGFLNKPFEPHELASEIERINTNHSRCLHSNLIV